VGSGGGKYLESSRSGGPRKAGRISKDPGKGEKNPSRKIQREGGPEKSLSSRKRKSPESTKCVIDSQKNRKVARKKNSRRTRKTVQGEKKKNLHKKVFLNLKSKKGR